MWPKTLCPVFQKSIDNTPFTLYTLAAEAGPSAGEGRPKPDCLKHTGFGKQGTHTQS